MSKPRFRQAFPSLNIGFLQPGPKNSITDVAGIKVGNCTVENDEKNIHTGVTIIQPCQDLSVALYASMFSLNGAGEMTGTHWLNETGLLTAPIALTSTQTLGIVQQTMQEMLETTLNMDGNTFALPLVTETFDGMISDPKAFPITKEHVIEAWNNLSEDVLEGNVGSGTGMLCLGHKGGLGTSSRLVPGVKGKMYTVGVFVQTNFGRLYDLTICGHAVGKLLAEQGWRGIIPKKHKEKSSIIIIIATDAPLIPNQCQRLAKRATMGLARVGGFAHNTSGDLFLCFSTANHIRESLVAETPELGSEPVNSRLHQVSEHTIQTVGMATMNSLMHAVAEATEEAILNAMCAAKDLNGYSADTKGLPVQLIHDLIGN